MFIFLFSCFLLPLSSCGWVCLFPLSHCVLFDVGAGWSWSFSSTRLQSISSSTYPPPVKSLAQPRGLHTSAVLSPASCYCWCVCIDPVIPQTIELPILVPEALLNLLCSANLSVLVFLENNTHSLFLWFVSATIESRIKSL